MSDLKKWGSEAYQLLRAIKGRHSPLKRVTLIALADATFTAVSLKTALGSKQTASHTAHYKWMHNDAAYRAAFDFLVGSEAAPGIARQARDAELDQMLQAAVAQVEQAHLDLQLLSAEAVQTYAEMLKAETAVTYEGQIFDHVADNRARIAAANAILDRIPQLAKTRKSDITSGGEPLAAPISIEQIVIARQKAAEELAEWSPGAGSE